MSYLLNAAESLKESYSLAEYYDAVVYSLFLTISFTFAGQAETASSFQMSCATFLNNYCTVKLIRIILIFPLRGEKLLKSINCPSSNLADKNNLSPIWRQSAWKLAGGLRLLCTVVLLLFNACLADRHSAARKPLRDLQVYFSFATGSASPPLLLCGQTQAFTCPSPASDYNPNLTLAHIPERTPQPSRLFSRSEHRELYRKLLSAVFRSFIQSGPEMRSYMRSKRRYFTN